MNSPVAPLISEGPRLGATPLGDGRCRFCVWAPLARSVEVHLISPREAYLPLEKEEPGYFQNIIDQVPAGSLYFYRLDGVKERPDPASRFQPQGVHGPSQVMDSGFSWHDEEWSGLPIAEYILYEIHVGAFSAEGTFDGIIPHLEELRSLGITALELMPVAQFPGERNWGYDGVLPFAVQGSYGGPVGLKRLIDAGHQRGLAVALDAVYNHLGPEGNYLAEYGDYFTDRYRTPWGAAINFDGPQSDQVRRFFIENALYWQNEFHVDALRVDAIHAIKDFSATTFLEELALATQNQAKRSNRRFHLIVESDLNDARVIRPRELGGYGIDAQWSDDFHHALHTLLTGESSGYYQDFGEIRHLGRALRDGYTYAGDYSRFRERRHGNSPAGNPARQFVICAQNHDQVGNRMLGERLSGLVEFEALKLAAGAVLLSPFIPLLFMGEEYGETAPFLYFVDHLDPALIEAVRRGRAEEFAAFAWRGAPPDPKDEQTYLRSKIDRSLRLSGRHRVLYRFYRELLRLRRRCSALAHLSKERLEVTEYHEERVLGVRRWTEHDQVFIAFNFSPDRRSLRFPVPGGRWRGLLDSAEPRWKGDGEATERSEASRDASPEPPPLFSSNGSLSLKLAPWSFILLGRDGE